MDDKEIVDLFWRRQEQAIAETKLKYSAYCQSIATNILSDQQDVLECENDTYLALWNCIPPHRPQKLSVFLGKLTRRISLDRLKARHAQKRGGNSIPLSLDELAQCIPDDSSLTATLEEKELSAAISRFLRRIPLHDRQVFLRRYWFCDSISRISEQTDWSEGKVKMNLLRTREKLRQFLRKEGYFNE